MLEKAPTPKDVIALGVNGIRKIWHDKKMRGAEELLKIGKDPGWSSKINSVGLGTEELNKSELYMLLEEHQAGLRS